MTGVPDPGRGMHRSNPLVGRATERATIDALLGDAERGVAGALLLTGPPAWNRLLPWRKKSTPRPPRRVVCRHGARSRPPSVLLLLGCGDWVAGEPLGADRVGRRS